MLCKCLGGFTGDTVQEKQARRRGPSVTLSSQPSLSQGVISSVGKCWSHFLQLQPVSPALRHRGFDTITSLMPSQPSLLGSTAILATLESVPAPRLTWTLGRTVCGTPHLPGLTQGGITRHGTTQPVPSPFGTQCQPGCPGQSGQAFLTSSLP